MARQLGQFLLSKGAINPAQLAVALDAQTRFGGRLGFNLVDLGYLSPLDLARHLGAYHGVEAVEPTEVRGIRWDILNSVSRELLLKHRAIPIAMSKGRITVVMSDPSNVQAIDEMSFATGKAVQARVAPDFVIKRALETYFGASFVELVRPHQALAVAHLKSEALAAAGGTAPPRAHVNGTDVRGGGRPGELEIERIPGLETRPARRPLDEDDEWLAARSPAEPTSLRGGRRQPSADLNVHPDDELPMVVGELVDAAATARGEVVPIHDVASACRLLADARHRADVAAVLLGYASTVFERAVLFRVGSLGLRGWKAIGGGLDADRVRGLRVPLGNGFMCDALARRGLVVSELRRDPSGLSLARALGGPAAPRSVCGARIDVRGKPVAFFYGDDVGAREVGASLGLRLQQGGHKGDLEILLRKVEVALEMVAVRRWLPKL